MNGVTLDTMVSRDDLLAHRAQPCISILIPTHRAGPGVVEDRIRLRDAVRDAEHELRRSTGLRDPEVAELLLPATRLIDDDAFWERQGDGLAVLLAPDREMILRLPIPVPEGVHVGERFHIRSLLPLTHPGPRFVVLALSRHDVRLLRGDRWRLTRVMVPGMPGSIEAALPFDEREESLQYHRSATRPGSADVAYHGHGGEPDADGARLRRYVQAIGHALTRSIHQDLPLVVAATSELAATFEVSGHPGHVVGVVEGNPDRLRDDELHALAWPFIRPLAELAGTRAAERFETLAGTGLAIDDPALILAAARDARVDSLLTVPATVRLEPDVDDVVEAAIVATLDGRGTVHQIEVVPGGGPLAAILRW